MTREEAIAHIKDIICENNTIKPKIVVFEQEKEALYMAIKALEQKPKTGHWIEVTNGRGGHECNICHEYAPSYRSGDEYLTKYCPDCGCRMVESQESEDKE